MPETQADAKVMKDIREAVRGLDDLDKVILPAVKGLPKREVDAEKAKRAGKKALTYIARNESLGKLRGAGLDKLSPLVRAQVEWFGQFLDALADVEGHLTMGRKQTAFKPADKYAVLVKSASRIAQQVPTPPRGTGPLIKELKKGVDPAGPLGPLIPLLPLALSLSIVQDLVAEARKKRPKYP